MAYPAFSAQIVSVITRITLGVLFASLVGGQLVRLHIAGQGGGVVVSDIAVMLFLSAVFLPLLLGVAPYEKKRYGVVAFFVVAPFLLWSISMLIGRSFTLGYEHVTIAALYWLRLASILLLFPAGVVAMREKKTKEYIKKVFVYMFLILLSLGFIQLLFFPNLEGIGGGWDPHAYRIVATWLDPNFFGVFLSLALPPALLWMRAKSISRLRIGRVLCGVLGCTAILLTKSRSTYGAVIVGLAACVVLWLLSSSIHSQWKKMVVPGIVTACILFLFTSTLLRERATQIIFHDPTIALRLDAYRGVWEHLVAPNILFGVGYNAYQFAAQDAGLISDFFIHSRSGSDSSILTLLVTTGVVGTVLFLIPILIGTVWHVKMWLLNRNYGSLVFVWATVVLLVHSQFENSLLYPHALIPYIFISLLTLL